MMPMLIGWDWLGFFGFMGWDQVARTLPWVAREARKSSWPDANAGWMLGKPPSVPALLMLYLEIGME